MGGKGSGRIPAPAGLKLLHGRSENRDSGGRLVPQTPRFAREAPEPPAELDDVARAEWDRVVDALEPLGLLKAADGPSLECYCRAVSDHREATAIITAEGRIITNPTTGHRHPHPAVADARASRAEILRFGREFGLTPSSEQHFANVDDDSDDESNPFSPNYRR
jgi:P27 family predicted phage terminase small subunit